MHLCLVSLFAIAALSGAVSAQDTATKQPNDAYKLYLEETEEKYRQLFPELLDKEMKRKGAAADNVDDVWYGAIQSEKEDENEEKARILNDVKAWQQRGGEPADRSLRRSLRRSLSYRTSISANAKDILDDDVPDATDIEWVEAFMSGKPIDHNLIWNASDLTEGNAADSIQNTSAMDESSFLPVLMRARLLYSVARARFRSIAASNPSAVFRQEDFEWASSFLNGELVDENLIFNSTDLDAVADDELGSATPTTTSLTDSTLQKRHHYKHPPNNALQVFNRYKRAMIRARRRARRRAHYKHYFKSHHKGHHETHSNTPKKPHHSGKTHHSGGFGSTHHPGRPISWPNFRQATHGVKKHNKNTKHHQNPKGKSNRMKHCFNEYWNCIVQCREAFGGAGHQPHCVQVDHQQ